MEVSNRITKVAIVGAGGNIGSFITKSLLATGKHIVTAITRGDSPTQLPAGVIAKKVHYADPGTLVEALKGQDVLVVTLSGFAPKETQTQLIQAAGAAGVPWIMPNEWSPDTANEALVNDVSAFRSKVEIRKEIEQLGKSSYLALCTGYWYEWSLAKPLAYGIDFAKYTVTFFDDGEARISTSTWLQIGRAVAALLISQKEMFKSVIRVTGTSKADWVITKVPSSERYATGLKEIKEGNYAGFSKMGCRIFFPDGCGNFEDSKGTLNEMLDLPWEDIDEATKVAMERAQATAN